MYTEREQQAGNPLQISKMCTFSGDLTLALSTVAKDSRLDPPSI